MSPPMDATVANPKIIQPVHETALMLPASRLRCHFGRTYRVKIWGRVAARKPKTATIPKTVSGTIILRILARKLDPRDGYMREKFLLA